MTGNTPQPEFAASLHGSEHRTYYPALDGLRAVAVLLVFAEHFVGLPLGWSGVDVFFVLSGFLITSILWKTRGEEHRFRNFYVRRTLRIFPVYYGVFLALLLVTPVLHIQWDWQRLSWLLYVGNWSYYFNLAQFNAQHWWDALSCSVRLHGTLYPEYIYIGHFWSLCVEEQFYLVWPFVVYRLQERGRILKLSAAIVLLMPVVRFGCFYLLPGKMVDAGILYHNTLFRFDALLLGAFVAMLWQGPWAAWLKRMAPRVFAVFSVIVLSVYGVFPHRFIHTPWFVAGWVYSLRFFCIDVAAAGLIVMALTPGSVAFRCLHVRPLRWLGMRSYGFYVYHYMGLYLLRDFAVRETGRYHAITLPVMGFALAVGVSWVSFRYLEQPFLRLKDRYA